MKTIAQLQEQIEALRVDAKGMDPDDPKQGKLYRKSSKQALFLRQCILYLEKDPSPDFVEDELRRVASQLRLIKAAFVLPPARIHENIVDKMRKKYEKEQGVALLVAQHKTLAFILRSA